MRIAAFVCGLIGGLISLFVGMFGGLLFGLASAGGSSIGGFLAFASFALPICALVGAGLTFKYPLQGGLMMLGSALATMLLFGFGGPSVLPIVLLGVGAALSIKDAMAPAQA